MLLTTAVIVVIERRDPSYVGTTTRVTLQWRCVNGIWWQRGATRWWAGHDPRPRGAITNDSLARSGDPEVQHAARGSVHIISRDEAVFTSDIGGSLDLMRQRPGGAYTNDCVMRFREA